MKDRHEKVSQSYEVKTKAGPETSYEVERTFYGDRSGWSHLVTGLWYGFTKGGRQVEKTNSSEMSKEDAHEISNTVRTPIDLGGCIVWLIVIIGIVALVWISYEVIHLATGFTLYIVW